MPKRVRRGFLLVAAICLAATVLIAFASPYVLRRMTEGCEHSIAQDLCSISRAVLAYRAEHGTTPPTLSSLRGRVAPALSCDTPECEYRSYRFRYTAAQGSAKPRYSISAQAPSGSGLSYYLDESGLVHYAHQNRDTTNSGASAEVAATCN